MGFRPASDVFVMGPRLKRILGGKALLLTDHRNANDARGNNAC